MALFHKYWKELSLIMSDQEVTQILRERMATIEANSQFHRETLAELSASLREVIATQGMVAGQENAIKALYHDLDVLKAKVADLDNRSTTSYFETQDIFGKIERGTTEAGGLSAELDKITGRIDDVVEKVDKNERFVWLMGKLIGGVVVLIPVALFFGKMVLDWM